MDRSEFRGWLKPEWATIFRDAFIDGLDDFDNEEWFSPQARALLTDRTSASARHDLILARLERAFVDIPEIQIKWSYGHALIMINDTVVMTVKKLDTDNRLARVNKTRQSHLILSQAPLPIEDMPSEALHIIGGYTVDASGTQYELYITCPTEAGKENEWEYKLTNAKILDVFAPAIAEAESADEPTGRVRLRGEIAEQQEEEDEERSGTDDSTG